MPSAPAAPPITEFCIRRRLFIILADMLAREVEEIDEDKRLGADYNVDGAEFLTLHQRIIAEFGVDPLDPGELDDLRAHINKRDQITVGQIITRLKAKCEIS